MIAYADTSVLMRLLLGQPDRLREWTKVKAPLTSTLGSVECFRTIERLRFHLGLDDEKIARLRSDAHALLGRHVLTAVSPEVLARAADPFPTSLGTLDAIHLSSALLWQQSEGRELEAFLTHDAELGRAARSMGLRVLGV